MFGQPDNESSVTQLSSVNSTDETTSAVPLDRLDVLLKCETILTKISNFPLVSF